LSREAVADLLSPALSSRGGEGETIAAGSRNMGKRPRNLAMVTAEIAAQVVAMIDVPTIAVGLLEWFAARIAIAVTGMS
jgi:hypothetical protein